MPRHVVSNILGLVGAIVGGALGVLVFRWIATRGFYAPIVPGGFVGLGSALLARHSSTARGIACAVLAVVAGVIAEWSAFPFIKDESLGYFLTHLNQLKTLTILLIGVGVVLAYWVGRDQFLGQAFAMTRPPGPREDR